MHQRPQTCTVEKELGRSMYCEDDPVDRVEEFTWISATPRSQLTSLTLQPSDLILYFRVESYSTRQAIQLLYQLIFSYDLDH